MPLQAKKITVIIATTTCNRLHRTKWAPWNFGPLPLLTCELQQRSSSLSPKHRDSASDLGAFSALFLQSSSPQIWEGPILSPGTTLRQKSRALLLDRAWLPTRCHRARPDDGERLARHLEGAALGHAGENINWLCWYNQTIWNTQFIFNGGLIGCYFKFKPSHLKPLPSLKICWKHPTVGFWLDASDCLIVRLHQYVADYLRPPWRERGRGPFWSWRVMDKMLNIRIM